MNKLQQFIDSCKNLQPGSSEDIQRFFEGVVFFPYDDELLLQAFLFFNINNYFPFCTELLLFESSPNGKNTEEGKCDFVYLTQDNKIALIETKFINTENTGATEQKRRNAHRNKVFQQVITLQQKFSNIWNIPENMFDCCIFTTENLSYRAETTSINAKYIPIKELKKWQQKTKGVLQTKSSVSSQTVFQENADN